MKVTAFLTDGFETVEALAVIDICRRAGIDTDTVSITGDKNVISAQNIPVKADYFFDEVNLEGAQVLLAPVRVVTDGNITTSRGMGTSVDLGLEIVKLLISEEKAKELAASTQYAD